MLCRLVRPMKRKGSRNGTFSNAFPPTVTPRSSMTSTMASVTTWTPSFASRLASRIRSTAAPPVLWRARLQIHGPVVDQVIGTSGKSAHMALATSLDASASPTVKWALARRLRSPPAALPRAMKVPVSGESGAHETAVNPRGNAPAAALVSS
jgi:hypothetical protein